MHLDDGQVEFFHKFGYILLRNVLTNDEVKKLRAACELDWNGEVLGRKEFDNILLDKRIINPLKQLMGDDVVYFGESNVRLVDKPKEGSRHIHTDTKNDDYDYSKMYPVFRVGLYLQDDKNYSGGLKLRPGSHKKFCADSRGIGKTIDHYRNKRSISEIFPGKSVNVSSMPGDLLIWNMRTHHSGYAVRVKGLKNYSFHPVIEDMIPEFLKYPRPEKRYIIFASYGTPSDQLEVYIKNRVERKNKQKYWQTSNKHRFDTPEIEKIAKENGVILRTDGLDYITSRSQ